MAMNGTQLGEAAWNAVKAQTGATYSPAEENKAKAIWIAIATEIVNHIVANAVVTVTTGIPVATTGSAVAQTGATTAPGTGTVA